MTSAEATARSPTPREQRSPSAGSGPEAAPTATGGRPGASLGLGVPVWSATMRERTEWRVSEAIEFGISMTLLRGAKDEARQAEHLGYDYLLTGEHVMFHTPVGNTLV